MHHRHPSSVAARNACRRSGPLLDTGARRSFGRVIVASCLALCVARTSDALSPAAHGWLVSRSGAQRIDRAFLNNASECGRAAIEAAGLALSRRIPAPVRDFARLLLEDHTRLNQRVIAIAARKGVHLTGAPSVVQQGRLEMLRKLDSEQFAVQYVRDFGVAVLNEMNRAFRDEVEHGRDADLRQFAEGTLPMLDGHLQQGLKLRRTLGAAVREPTGEDSSR